MLFVVSQMQRDAPLDAMPAGKAAENGLQSLEPAGALRRIKQGDPV
jgi:hypothetical protein